MSLALQNPMQSEPYPPDRAKTIPTPSQKDQPAPDMTRIKKQIDI